MENACPQYLSTMGMQLAAGRNFHEIAAQDSNNIIINEAFAHIISKDNVIGSLITRNNGQDKYRVIGVVKTLSITICTRVAAPLILFCDPANTSFLTSG